MTTTRVNPPKLANSPQWIFAWRPLGSPWMPKLIALALVGTAFTLLVTSVRIQLVLPEKSSPRSASLIYLGHDPQSRALAMRAREGGPFPSRFELKDWPGLVEMEQQAMNAARYQPPPYVPAIAELPEENLVKPLVLAPRGESFFPERASVTLNPPDLSQIKMAPVLYPLSKLAIAAIPEELPDFTKPVDDKLSTPSWRFLLRLNAAGRVVECVSLETGTKDATDALEEWIRQVSFTPMQPNKESWIALGIGFTNQPDDGSDAR
jgi:hypothetical protein